MDKQIMRGTKFIMNGQQWVVVEPIICKVESLLEGKDYTVVNLETFTLIKMSKETIIKIID